MSGLDLFQCILLMFDQIGLQEKESIRQGEHLRIFVRFLKLLMKRFCSVAESDVLFGSVAVAMGDTLRAVIALFPSRYAILV